MRSLVAQITLIEDIVIRYANVLFEGANTRNLKSGVHVYLYYKGIDECFSSTPKFSHL